ncbi:MAG: hypothetical protein ACJAZ2_000187 [Glaciecola sp.]|jgi:hypothetical protein
MIKFTYRDLRLICSSTLVVALYAYHYFISYTPPELFLFSLLLVYFSATPKYVLHPQNFLFGFYTVWYTLPLMFATRYEHLTFSEDISIQAYCMLICSFLVGYNTLHFSTKGKRIRFTNFSFDLVNKVPIMVWHYIFVGTSILSCILVMATSPYGLVGWLKNPGQAFQFRDGSGLMMILLIFSSGLACTTAGVMIRKAKGVRKLVLVLLFLCMIGIYLVCILHRQRLVNYLLILFLTIVFYMKAKLKFILPLLIFIAGSVILSTYLRMGDDLGSGGDDSAAIALNYFDTYAALSMSLKHEVPEWFGSSFMAFNKFKVGVGYNADIAYSISQKFTPIYFPGWSKRATVQFPIETEMYLNGYYVGYIPILFLYFLMIGKIYKYGFISGNVGMIYVSVYTMFEMIGHLRGMFIAHTDFYNYPVLFISYFLLNKISDGYNLRNDLPHGGKLSTDR